jgi:hypothetical protein
VAGQDATKNQFSFKRLRSPYILETASSYMIRSAGTGASLTFDLDGNIIMNCGAQHNLVLRSDFANFSLAQNAAKVQLDPSNSGQVIITAGSENTVFVVDGAASSFLTAGTFQVGTSGAAGTGHAITLEQVVSLFMNFVCAMQASTGWSPTFTPIFAGAAVPTLTAIGTAMLLGASATTVPISVAPGGNLTATGLLAIIQSALTAQGLDPNIPGTLTPGVGRPGFII